MLDNIPKKEKDFFIKGIKPLTSSLRESINSSISKMRRKYEKSYFQFFSNKIEKEYITFSGGNVTFFFGIGRFFNKLQNQMPFSPFKAIQLEGGFDEIIKNKVDIGMTGEISKEKREDFTNKFGKFYSAHKSSFKDRAFFYSCSSLLDKYSSIENLKQNVKTIVGRQSTQYKTPIGEEFYSTIPNGMSKNPSMISDQNIINHFCLLNSSAVWLIFDSCIQKNYNLVKLEKDPVIEINRFIIKKKIYRK
jgi:hypothetical protein